MRVERALIRTTNHNARCHDKRHDVVRYVALNSDTGTYFAAIRCLNRKYNVARENPPCGSNEASVVFADKIGNKDRSIENN